MLFVFTAERLFHIGFSESLGISEPGKVITAKDLGLDLIIHSGDKVA